MKSQSYNRPDYLDTNKSDVLLMASTAFVIIRTFGLTHTCENQMYVFILAISMTIYIP